MTRQKLTRQELDHLLTVEEVSEEPPASESSLLRLLSSTERSVLVQLLTERQYTQGDVIFEEGDPGDAAYLIWSGRVAVVKGDLHSPTILGFRRPGEVVGEMALLEGQPRSASVVALENLRLLRIDREGFRSLLDSDPAVRASIMASLSGRLREADNVRQVDAQVGRQLVQQVSRLQDEKEQLLEIQRVRQETSDLVIHDLRSPLGAISGVLQMLEMVLPEDVLKANRELLQIANAAYRRMQRLVDSLLDVARLETGEARLRLSTVDLERLIEEALRRESLALADADISCRLEIPPDLPPVTADEDRIDRVLANLIDNAIKYTPKGGQLSVVVELRPDRIVVSVTDVGPGIPPQERQRIFERFTQLAQDRSRRRGFGLGLAFCRLAVEAHGGQIWVEEGDGGGGSRFCFTLPRSPLPHGRPANAGTD